MRRHTAALFLLLPLLSTSPPAGATADESLKKSVVKVLAVLKRPDWYQPWSMAAQFSTQGSGCVLPGRRILTNAHIVGDSVFLQVLKVGDTTKYTARVEHVGHDVECALLTVEDPTFFEGTVPVTFGDVPEQRDKVAAYGFPMGGNELSITEGVVSRVEVQTYAHAQSRHLAVQIDAAINPGNSGGPVFRGRKMVGLSFQGIQGGDNIGYMVPVPILKRFLADVEDGTYDGTPALGIYWQKMESASLKRYHKMPSEGTGVLVTSTVWGSSVHGVLEAGDVLTKLDDVALADDGTVPFRRFERLAFSHLLSLHQVGDKIPIEVFRNGRRRRFTVELRGGEPLVPRPLYDVKPTYLIVGGLVFTPLTYNYMDLWSWKDVPARFRFYYEHGQRSAERREVVVLSQVLPHAVNRGYHDEGQLIVHRVNGRDVGRMEDLVEAFGNPEGDFHVVELEVDAGGRRIVLDAAKTQEATREILDRFRIPSDRSEDLRVGGGRSAEDP